MAEKGYIEVQGLKEFQRATRRAADQNLPKRLGEAHRKTGEYIRTLVDRESDPSAVGEGKGASVRPSASKREVLLRVGGTHRTKAPMSQWGRNVVRAFRPAPRRPYIKQIADRHRDEIGDFYLNAVSDAMDPAFYNTEP